MSRFELGYLLLALLIAGVAAAVWYLAYNSHGRTWKRDVRKRRKAHHKVTGDAAETPRGDRC